MTTTLRLFLVSLLLGISGISQAVEKVVMFSQTYCPNCAVTKVYLEKHNIAYAEFFIDKSDAALDYFLKLGGRGTPFLIVNNRKMQGFDPDRFWYLYQQGSDS